MQALQKLWGIKKRKAIRIGLPPHSNGQVLPRFSSQIAHLVHDVSQCGLPAFLSLFNTAKLLDALKAELNREVHKPNFVQQKPTWQFSEWGNPHADLSPDLTQLDDPAEQQRLPEEASRKEGQLTFIPPFVLNAAQHSRRDLCFFCESVVRTASPSFSASNCWFRQPQQTNKRGSHDQIHYPNIQLWIFECAVAIFKSPPEVIKPRGSFTTSESAVLSWR